MQQFMNIRIEGISLIKLCKKVAQWTDLCETFGNQVQHLGGSREVMTAVQEGERNVSAVCVTLKFLSQYTFPDAARTIYPVNPMGMRVFKELPEGLNLLIASNDEFFIICDLGNVPIGSRDNCSD